MKFIILTLFVSATGFAYNSSPVGNHPVKENLSMPEKRVPASNEMKNPKPISKETKKHSETKK